MNKQDDNQESSVVKLLAERAKLEEKIRQDHTRELTVFFCDIKGYTSYTEIHGDLAGRAIAQRVLDAAAPALKEFQGIMVKTIGDAIMAHFDDPARAVRFTIALQQSIKAENLKHQKMEQIQLRIGLNKGEVIVDSGDLYGDAVNIAARIEPQAKPGGILVSPSVYAAVKDEKDIVCMYAKKVSMKGKSEQMDLYQVVWDGERLDDYSDDMAAAMASSEKQGTTAAEPLSAVEKKGPSLFKWGAVAALILFAAIVFKTVDFGPSSGGNSTVSMSSDPYVSGFSALRQGALDLAGAAFDKLDKMDPRYFEARAALAYFNKDNGPVEEYLQEALANAGDRVYVHVLEGDVRLRNGRQDEALVSYQKATGLENGMDWQKALAYNGMGRIQASRQQGEDALASFLEASRLDPNDAMILTNQGVQLERLGRMEEATVAYQKALKADPEDRLARRKLALAEQREKAAIDKEKQERINTLVDELSARFKSGNVQDSSGGSVPGEITFPVALWLMQFEERGDLPAREGEDEVFIDLLGQELQASDNVELVERDLLDSLLTELKLGASELADKNTSLRLGSLLAAKLMINGSIYRRGPVTLVSIKVIETETSRIRVSTSIELNGDDSLLMSTGKVAAEIMRKLGKVYPDLLLKETVNS